MSVYSEIADDVCYVLMSNLDTIDAHSNTLQGLWTTSTQDLTEEWQNGGINQDGTLDTNNPVAAYLEAFEQNPNGPNHTDTYLQGILQACSNVADWSTSLVTRLINDFMTVYNSDPSKSSDSSFLSAFQQQSTLINSKYNIETAIGDSQTKSWGSIVQQDASAQQPQADFGNSVTGILAAFAGLLAQIFG